MLAFCKSKKYFMTTIYLHVHVSLMLLWINLFKETTEIEEKSKAVSSKLSPRQQVVMELLQTEKNYVAILHTILNVSCTNCSMSIKWTTIAPTNHKI